MNKLDVTARGGLLAAALVCVLGCAGSGTAADAIHVDPMPTDTDGDRWYVGTWKVDLKEQPGPEWSILDLERTSFRLQITHADFVWKRFGKEDGRATYSSVERSGNDVTFHFARRPRVMLFGDDDVLSNDREWRFTKTYSGFDYARKDGRTLTFVAADPQEEIGFAARADATLELRAVLDPSDSDYATAEVFDYTDRFAIHPQAERLRLGAPSRFQLAWVARSIGSLGFPALYFEVAQEDRTGYERWTARHVGKSAAFILNGKVQWVPSIVTPVPGNGTIVARYSEQDLTDLIARLKAQ